MLLIRCFEGIDSGRGIAAVTVKPADRVPLTEPEVHRLLLAITSPRPPAS